MADHLFSPSLLLADLIECDVISLGGKTGISVLGFALYTWTAHQLYCSDRARCRLCSAIASVVDIASPTGPRSYYRLSGSYYHWESHRERGTQQTALQ